MCRLRHTKCVWSVHEVCWCVWSGVADCGYHVHTHTHTRRLRVSCPGLLRRVQHRRMTMWLACMPSSAAAADELELVQTAESPQTRGCAPEGKHVPILQIEGLAGQVVDAYAIRGNAMSTLTLCAPYDTMLFGLSKLLAHIYWSWHVRGRVSLST